MIDECVENLFGAILELAIEDYKLLLSGKKLPTKDVNINECERFFRSDLFDMMSNSTISGEEVISIMRSRYGR